MKMNIVEKALLMQSKGWYRISHLVLAIFGIEIPPEVKFSQIGGKDSVRFVHRSSGLVLHPNITVGKRVQFYQNVTIGKKKPWDISEMGGVIIEDDVIICAGAVILFGKGTLRVAKGSIIGANSVLTQSTSEDEIWAGVPARKIGNRK